MNCKLNKIVSTILAIILVLSVFPIQTFAADANLGSVSNADNIGVTAEFNYGHEIHYGSVDGKTYPLFCIEYGTTSPSSSYLAGRKEMAGEKVLEAARWIFAGYYMEHDNTIEKKDMAMCQKKVWSIMGSSTSWTFSDSDYNTWCDNAQNNMKRLNTYPSFDGENIGNIVAGESKTITDANKVLSDYPAFTYTKNNITVTHKSNENKLTITAGKNCTTSSFTFPAGKYFKNNTGNDDELLLYYPYGSESYQKLIYSAYYDPIDISFTANITPLGNLKLVKTSEDGNVSGIKFTIEGNDYSKTVTTNSNGEIEIDGLVPGKYTVTEENIDKYVPQKSQTVTIQSNKTAVVSFNNTLKKFNVNVTKVDIENTYPQGDASLASAVYGIYNNGNLVDTYTTDEYGKFTTDYYVCGDNWTIQEISSSEGYLLDTTIYHVGAEAKNYNIELNTTSNTVNEQVIKGNIAIIKHTDDGSTQIETPEKGAEFQVYLKSAGSFANADTDEKDTIVCDEDGFASTKLLPYGVYTVHQTKGWDGREKIKDFDVFINEEGKTYKFLINNSNFSSYLKVVKLDKETGKQIAYEGAGFEIYDSDGHRVSMQYTYPQVTTVHTFYTNSEGYLITPEKLPYGNYTLVEVQAPYGYVLDSTPIPFSINQENSSTDTGITVVKVKAHDLSQKGVIEITKTGEIFASVNEDNNIYTPVYKTGNLANAVFEIYASEDITTLDGTIRYYQGEKVDEITTDENGFAKSKELYLGKYTVVERTAPNGYVNSNEQYNIELTYAGQNVTVTSTALSVCNNRQKVTVSLSKIMEQDETFNIGDNNEITSVKFGLCSNENIEADDGKIIPADALVSIADCGENGFITFDCDLPIGYKFYVKEIATNEHYILSDTKYEFETTYEGQEISTIDINISGNNPIENKIIYGSVEGLKIDRETSEIIEGALFGLFKEKETEYTEKNAILTAFSDENGIFIFENIPFGSYVIKELEPAANYLENNEIYHITVSSDKQIIEITAVNDKIPELKTTATVDGGKTTEIKDKIVIKDTVEYKHLIAGTEYTLKGVLMDKSTGKPFKVDGREITAELTFAPNEPNGKVEVEFTFDGFAITKDTELVVFESLYRDGIEISTHSDINDKDQTVTITVPQKKAPETGDDRNLGFLFGLSAIAFGGIVSTIIILIKKRKDDED